MKKFSFILSVLFLFACSNKKDSPQPFSPSMLFPQYFSISGSTDTALTTLHGSIIRIARGTFASTSPVKIEIREALTPDEMLAAGLVTESNGILLRSGGMIYINATTNDGDTARLLKPVKVSIPNGYYDSAMQVYKGVDTGGAGVNWIEPTPTDSNDQSKSWQEGKILFQTMCAQCHRLFKSMTGPPLAGVENRGPWRDRQELYKYIRNTQMYIDTNSYVKELVSRYRSVMTPFPALSDKDIDNIISYINNETEKGGPEEYPFIDSSAAPAATLEPCLYSDTTYIPRPRRTESFLEGSTDAFSPVSSTDDDTVPISLDDPAKRRTQFTDIRTTYGMYDFEIETLGWYNIDAEMRGYAGTTEVKVSVQLANNPGYPFHVYLFCPEKQVLSVANEKEDRLYTFDKINGGIPLFLNDRGIAFAFTTAGDKILYGISEFSIRQEQTINITVNETTKEALIKALAHKNLNGIKLNAEPKEMLVREIPCDGRSLPDTATTVFQ